MFCMLLRKQLLGGRVLSLKQIGGDRVLHLAVDTVNELGDHVQRLLILEVMGRHSNLILVDEQGRIIDAARHVNQDMSRVRQIQPGLAYAPPPGQDKLAPEEATPERLLRYLEKYAALPLAKALGQSLTGFSAPAARELCCRLTGSVQGTLTPEELPRAAERLADFLRRMKDLQPPVVLLDAQGDPADVFPFPYVSCDTARQKPFPSLSAALENYFGVRDQKDRLEQKSSSMVRLLKTHVERCEKKLALQNEELANAARMEEYRLMGELLNANLWQLHRGQEAAVVTNYYDEAGGQVTIPLDKYAFRWFNPGANRWEVEGGTYRIQVGPNAGELPLSAPLEVAGTKPGAVYDREALACYFSGQVEDVPDEAFAALLGRPIPEARWDRSAPLTLLDSFYQLSYARGRTARFADLLLARMARRKARRGEPDPVSLFIRNMPFRGLVKLSNGLADTKFALGVLDMANGHGFRGFGKAAAAFVSARLEHRRRKKRLGR